MTTPEHESANLLALFDRISNDILSAADLSSVLSTFAQEIVASGVFRSLVVALVDQNRRRVRVAEAITRTASKDGSPTRREDVIGVEYSLDDPNITASTARNGKMEVIDGWDPRFNSGFSTPATTAGNSYFFIPVLRQDETIAVVETACVATERAGALERIEAMKPLLNHVGVAITHAELFSALELSRLESQLERDRLKRYIDLSQTIFFVIDRSGAIKLLNRYGCERLGYSPEEIVGRDAIDLAIPEGQRSIVREILEEFVGHSEELTGSVETDIATRSGATKRVHWHITALLDQFGSVAELVGAGDDITDERELEEQLRQSQKMEAVGTLAGGIAHDFNNLLSVIVGHAELLASDPSLPPGLIDSVRDITAAADRAGNLVHKLLAFSRKQLMSIRPVDLNAIVRSVAELLAPLIGDRVELALDLAEGLPSFRADDGQIEHVIMNLAANAKDAMPDGGRLLLSTHRESFAEHPRFSTVSGGEYVVLEVRDSGSGMRPEVMSRIFEPFYTTKPLGRGSGLGLSMVYGIVKQSGGHIAVESVPGEGSTFHLYFPLMDSDPPHT